MLGRASSHKYSACVTNEQVHISHYKTIFPSGALTGIVTINLCELLYRSAYPTPIMLF